MGLSLVPFKLADIGEGILKVDVLQVFVKEGDVVQEFDKLCEVQSDKATVEITSKVSGTIQKLYVTKGASANVGSVIADIRTDGDTDAPAVSAAPATPAPAPLASRGSSVVPFKLADIGEGILKVDVLQVFVKEGDIVQEFDKLCEVQSDKATVEITSKVSGTIQKLYVTKGASANVGSVIADIRTEADDVHGAAHSAPVAQASAPPAASAPSAARPVNRKVLATPATRRIAMENNVDLSQVEPTGKGGRTMKEDVVRYLEGGRVVATTVAPVAQLTVAPPAPPAATASAYGVAAKADRTVAITGIRKAMVKAMTEANKIPSFGASDEIELTNLMRIRGEMKPLIEARDKSLKLSFMPFFLKAASLALLQYPELNAYTNEDCTELLVKGSHNIGFAMDTPMGLVVPNIKNVESKSIFDIAKDLQAMMAKGARGAFSPSDLQGGTFTISNIGSIGATYTKPVIFAPQVAIGAIGRMQKVPRFDANDNVVKAHIINVSWCADHRVVDGATMVRFNNLFKTYVEQPAMMLMDSK
jgi:2-oxoisovalerate dehydrogenase E2 component (dihydrolipoyl transacylase)